MRKLRGELNLAQKALSSDGLRDIGAKYLERDVPIMPLIVGEINRRHPTFAELALERVAGKRPRDLRYRSSH
jgi:hypothetical protein